MSTITITGASGSIATINGGNKKTNKAAQTIANEMNNNTKKVDIIPLSNSTTSSTSYAINPIYQYVVLGDNANKPSHYNLSFDSSNPTAHITILSSNNAGFTYRAESESGTIVNTAGNLEFRGKWQTGNWNITSGDSDDSIDLTMGNNTVHAGLGNNSIRVGTGNNEIYSEGHDSIVESDDNYNNSPTDPMTKVTLAGGNSTVSLTHAFIVDVSSNNNIQALNNSTVVGGTNSTVSFFSSPKDKSIFQGGNNNTISGTAGYSNGASNIQAIHGTNNQYQNIRDFTFLNGDGNTTATSIYGESIIFGAKELNLTLSANKTTNLTSSILFVADAGNETLNASGSTSPAQIWANTVTGAKTSLVATGGSGNDIFGAGTGNATFTGGAGSNLFMFNKESSDNGNTVITDFSASSSNQIALFNYGLNNNSLKQLLQNATHDTHNNTILHLDQHTITLQNTNVADLQISQFQIADTSKT